MATKEHGIRHEDTTGIVLRRQPVEKNATEAYEPTVATTVGKTATKGPGTAEGTGREAVAIGVDETTVKPGKAVIEAAEITNLENCGSLAMMIKELVAFRTEIRMIETMVGRTMPGKYIMATELATRISGKLMMIRVSARSFSAQKLAETQTVLSRSQLSSDQIYEL